MVTLKLQNLERKATLAAALAVLAMLVVPSTLAGQPAASTPPAAPPQSAASSPIDTVLDAVAGAGAAAATVLPSGQVFDAPACNYVEAPTTTTPGRSRPSLRIGVNDFGTFGMGPQVSTPLLGAVGTGFQMPIGAPHENLAVGWWGEGYLMQFTNSGGLDSYYPSDGAHGTVQKVDDFYLDSGRYTTYRVTVALPALATADPDDGLLVDFEFTLDKTVCDVTLRTHVQNQSDFTMDVDYKRVVDWDNLDSQNGAGVYSSDFQVAGNTLTATRSVNGQPHYECRTAARGLTLPYAIDAYAWDDTGIVGPGSTYVTSYAGDGNAGFNFVRNGLPPGGTWDTVLVYDCSFLTSNLAAVQCGGPLQLCAVLCPTVCWGAADES
ncbi:MAG: hypothetical protein QOI63_303 [Thermoplasmata archaeon]|nr:hypothetical protein [Thermoplasmata archaeon]